MKKNKVSIAVLFLIISISILAGYYLTDTAIDTIANNNNTNQITYRGSFPSEDDLVTIGNVLNIAGSDKYLFLLDQRGSKVHTFDSSGNFIRSIGQSGPGPGEFHMPLSMDFSENKLYVFEQSNMQIQNFSEEGDYSGVLIFEGSYENITMSGDMIWLTNHYFRGMPQYMDMPGVNSNAIYTIYDQKSEEINEAGIYPPVMADKNKIGTILTEEYNGRIYSLNRKLFFMNIYNSATKDLINTIYLKGGIFNDAIEAVKEDYNTENLISIMDFDVNQNGIYIAIHGSELSVYKFNFDAELMSHISFSDHYNKTSDDRSITNIYIREMPQSNIIRYYLMLYSDFPRVLMFDEIISQ